MEDSRKSWLRIHFPSGGFVAAAALAGGSLAGIVVYVGAYDIGADAPHSKPVYWLVEQFRDRSIAVRSRDISVPANLMDVKRLQSGAGRSEEHTSELQSLMRISYAVFCLKKKKIIDIMTQQFEQNIMNIKHIYTKTLD